MRTTKIFGLFILVVSVLFGFAGQLGAGGFIAVSDPETPWLQLVSHSVDVKINDLEAETVLEQEFRNSTSRRLEGTFLFPVPKGAALRKFSMFINGKEMPAELVEAGKAKSIYEDIVRQQKDPALFTYNGQDVFKVRIFPIEPGSIKKIRITYFEELQRNNGSIGYSYDFGPDKNNGGNFAKLNFNLSIDSADDLSALICSLPNAKIERSGTKRAVINWSSMTALHDVSILTVDYTTVRKGPGFIFRAHKISDEDGYFQVNITPDFHADATTHLSQDVVFVLDTSGSMAGEKIEQAKKALLFCIRTLNKDDRFNVIRFSTEAEPLFSSPEVVNAENIKKAESFISGFQAMGGTYISEALKLAVADGYSDGRPHVVMFLTDGKPTIGETDENKLFDIVHQSGPGIRVFTFGIGYDINTRLLDRIAEETRAARTYVMPNEDIEVKVSDLFSKIKDPVMTGLTIKYEGDVHLSKTYPASDQMPDLFKGTSITVSGRYTGTGASSIIIDGIVNGKKERFVFNVSFPNEETKNEQVPVFWAIKRTAWLLDKVRLNGADKELTDEIISIARRFGIVTPYTSWLILEDEQQMMRNDPRVIRQMDSIPSPAGIKESHRVWSEMKNLSGADSVRASREFDDIKNAEDTSSMSKSIKKDSFVIGGEIQEKKYVQGRVFRKVNDIWMDPVLLSVANSKKIEIKFGSDEYFRLLRSEPAVADILSLGKKVMFQYKGINYNVVE